MLEPQHCKVDDATVMQSSELALVVQISKCGTLISAHNPGMQREAVVCLHPLICILLLLLCAGHQ